MSFRGEDVVPGRREASGVSEDIPPKAVPSPLWILGLAAAYYVTGRLGLLLAIPPGYATAVFPASGVALAGVVLVGHRVWPGVWLGSFLINLGLSASPATAACIGLGASAQAVIGGLLVRRFSPVPESLETSRGALRFLSLGGPISCLVGASVGVAALVQAGAFGGGRAPFNWFTWWVGDALGVLIFAPCAVLVGLEPRRWRRYLGVMVPLLAAFAVATLLFVSSSGLETRELQQSFRASAAELDRAFDSVYGRAVEELDAIVSLYASQPEVTRAQFDRFGQSLLRSKPGIQALEWCPVVKLDERDAFEREAQKSLPQFQILQREGGGQLVPAAPRPYYLPIYFVVPMEGNEAAFGFDLASDAQRLVTLEKARDLGITLGTSPIRLVQERGSQMGQVLCSPIYGGPHATVAERRENLQGFALGVFRLGDLLAASLADRGPPDIRVELFAGSSTEAVAAYVTGSGLTTPEKGQTPAWSTRSTRVGLPWRLAYYQGERSATRRGLQSYAILTLALLFVGLLGVFLLAEAGRARSVDRLVLERTDELEVVNRDLTAAKARAEVASQAKSEFLATMSHELRTPLNAILGFGSMLADGLQGPLNDRQQRYVGNIVTGGTHLLALVNDLLDVAKVEAGKLELDIRTLRVGQALSKAARSVESLVTEKGITLRLGLAENLPPVLADPRRLDQILYNLLSNAIKFTPAGGQVELLARPGQSGTLEVVVNDEGIGIRPEDQQRIFQKFEQVDSTLGRSQGGTGLGLALTRMLVELHGGSIDVASSGIPGEGTRFTLQLPVADGSDA